MTQFGSNEEFFDTLKHLIYRWCDERRLPPPRAVTSQIRSLNGMTDGWLELQAALRSLRSHGSESYTPLDWDTVNDLIRAADRAIHPIKGVTRTSAVSHRPKCLPPRVLAPTDARQANANCV